MIILGPPASGKTGLALRLAAELSRPVLCKDDVKEALFDVLGSTDREGSRRFSEAALAAVLSTPERFAGRNVAIVCSGGNISPAQLAALWPATG